MAIINYKIIVNLKNDWIESGGVRRVQTPDEHLDGYCQCCFKEAGEFEATIKMFFIEKEDWLLIGKRCLRRLSTSIIRDENFSSLNIVRL